MSISPQPVCSKSAPADRPCKVVTLYEDFPAAIRAHDSFGRLMGRFSSERPVHATSWSFGMLGTERLKATVARDAAEADVILVSANGDREIPPHVASCIADCISRKPDARPVVVALHDEALKADGAAGPLCKSLKQVADRRHAAFLCGADLKEITARKPSAVRSAVHEARSTGAADRWFGIND
jgi:hypothetical protein